LDGTWRVISLPLDVLSEAVGFVRWVFASAGLDGGRGFGGKGSDTDTTGCL
jgi:hypothetical protein